MSEEKAHMSYPGLHHAGTMMHEGIRERTHLANCSGGSIVPQRQPLQKGVAAQCIADGSGSHSSEAVGCEAQRAQRVVAPKWLRESSGALFPDPACMYEPLSRAHLRLLFDFPCMVHMPVHRDEI